MRRCGSDSTLASLLACYPSAVMAASVMDLFAETGAYLRGHFRLTSGLHSGEYLQCAKVLAFPEYAETRGRELAVSIEAKLGAKPASIVVSPAIGGIVIEHEVGRACRVSERFAER